MESLVGSGDTLVFYMAAKNLETLVSQLITNGCATHTPLAVIEQATTEYQQVHISTLEKFSIDLSDVSFSSPSLVIIGKVVALYNDFGWFHPSNEPGSVFSGLKSK
ncbi:MAG: hypothetical protein HC867_07895 [Bacteroidia bacterium]|nr:hypothetical protein [Bacteroidia bacterium]